MSRVYTSEETNNIAFPLGGIGAGMVCINGVGALCDLSIEHHPNLHTHLGYTFAAIHDGAGTRLIEGPVNPGMKPSPTHGFPRYGSGAFTSEFPFARLTFRDRIAPIQAAVEAFSPCIPLDADSSSLPLASLKYTLHNCTSQPQQGVFSFNIQNPLQLLGYEQVAITRLADGIRFSGSAKGAREAHLSVLCDDEGLEVDAQWFRGAFFDMSTLLWKRLAKGEAVERPSHSTAPHPGASLLVPFTLAPLQSHTVTVKWCWYVPKSDLRAGHRDVDKNGLMLDEVLGGGAKKSRSSEETHTPYYAARFASIDEVEAFWRDQYEELRDGSLEFARAFHNSSLPDAFIQAASRNLSILKSPTVLRDSQGRFWGWEGSNQRTGSCHGSSTHVYNYAQAIPSLFPELEQTMREVEFDFCQNERGHQNFRAWLPIAVNDHDWHACADGQLGGIIKAYRKWSEDADDAWLGKYWRKIVCSMEYCIASWDPDETGTLIRPHHNTYDSEIWGADALGTGFYLGAAEAMGRMARYLGEDASRWERIRDKARNWMEQRLFNGEYFSQLADYRNAGKKPDAHPMNCSEEDSKLFDAVGPKYQYGNGCLADQLLGIWLSRFAGLDNLIDEGQEGSALMSIFKNNFFKTLEQHVNPQRPLYAFGNESALILCTWKEGDEPAIPFPYSREAWTGVEYALSSYLLMKGHVEEALQIVSAVNRRYDGRYRNPFAEIEAGHFYVRALASYALITAYSNARYEARSKTLYLKAPKGDFHHFFCTKGGYGIVGVRNGEPFFQRIAGSLLLDHIDYTVIG